MNNLEEEVFVDKNNKTLNHFANNNDDLRRLVDWPDLLRDILLYTTYDVLSLSKRINVPAHLLTLLLHDGENKLTNRQLIRLIGLYEVLNIEKE